MVDSTKGVTTYSNVCIPVQNASIGDVLCHKNDANDLGIDNFIAVVGSTVTTTPPDGYSWYGVIYGFEKGGIMVRALSASSKEWISGYSSSNYTDIDNVFNNSYHESVINSMTSDVGYMRNGSHIPNTTIGMNAYAISAKTSNSSVTSANLHPTTAYTSSANGLLPPMTKQNFDQDKAGAKTLYGTYYNYLKQTFSVMKGKQAMVFGIRCGKSNTKSLSSYNGMNGEIFQAARFCATFYAVSIERYSGNWRLPDMYELATMMSDDSFDACDYAHSVLGGRINRGVNLWSSMYKDSGHVWVYHNFGYAGSLFFINKALAVPVTLISLS